MSELREAAQAALEHWDKVSGIFRMTTETNRLRAALAQPKTKLRDQHKAFAEWFLQQNPIAPNVEDMAWSAWKAALAAPENRPCTCHPDDNPPQPCAQRYALTECKALAQPETAAEPVAWLNRYHAAMVTQDHATANAMGFTIPLYAHPPSDEWRPASDVPKDSKPHAYLLEKLAMVMPLFQEARDALTAITEQQRIARGISPTLADRMDAAGTYSVDDWRRRAAADGGRAMSEDRPQYQAANKSFGDPIPTPIELAKKLRYLSNVKVTGAAPTGD